MLEMDGTDKSIIDSACSNKILFIIITVYSMQEKEEKSNIKRICIVVVYKRMFKAIEHGNAS